MDDRSRSRVPWLYRLVRDNTGQSETIGVVLLLGIAVVGTGAIVVFGSSALQSARDTSQLQRTEHTLTLFDSRSAMVALGESDSQQVGLAGSGDGVYRVEEDLGRMKVVHRNYTTGNDEVIYNATLGALVYENGGTTIAYQGGGVWRKTENYSSMVSPPEFHYRASTLTLPIIRVRGNESAAGGVSATIESREQARRVFPNASGTGTGTGAPYDAGGAYVNPVTNGSVMIWVQSDYYQGWAEFFRTRSDGEVNVYHGNDTVSMKLVGGGEVGDFSMPADGNEINVPGMPSGHPLTKFNLTLIDDDGDNADFDNLQWSITAEQGAQQWETHLRSDSACGGADVSVYYSEDGGGTYQGWKAECDDNPSLEWTKSDIDGDGADEKRLQVNLTSSSVDLEYEKLSNSELMAFNPGSQVSNPTWTEHGATIPWESGSGKTWADGEETTFHNVTNHYLSQFGSNYDIKINDKNSDTVNEGQSKGTMNYPASDQIYITFLHITENEVRVTF